MVTLQIPSLRCDTVQCGRTLTFHRVCEMQITQFMVVTMKVPVWDVTLCSLVEAK